MHMHMQMSTQRFLGGVARLAGVGVLLLAATTASAASISHVEIGPELRKGLEKTWGTQDGDILIQCVQQGLQRALQRVPGAAAAPVSIVVTIEDAMPSRPTFRQQSENPSLDAMRSVSLGGARLSAQLLATNGHVLDTVRHQQYATDLREVALSAAPWSDACRAAQQFAGKVARAAAVAATTSH